jgi:PPM family protein phosphatase
MDPDLGLFVVADGMGGHRHGHLAAELACTTLRHYVESSRNPTDVTWPFGYNWKLSLEENRLVTGMLLANRHVWKRSEEDPGYAGMGSTIVAALVQGTRAAFANVGDSRAYLFRNHDLSQLTIDDTWLNTVFKQSTLDQKTLLKHPMRNVLTQAAGTNRHLDVHSCELELKDGDQLLLCSDGLHGVVMEECIRTILASERTVAEQVVQLSEAALNAGAPDNVSCILLRYEWGVDKVSACKD